MDGDDYHLAYEYSQISSIDTYEKGSKVTSKYFDEDGKLSSEQFLKMILSRNQILFTGWKAEIYINIQRWYPL